MPASIPQDYYAVSAGPAPPFPRLTGTVKTEICVIGGGYTGLSAALHLAEAGAQPVLLEAGTVGFGASGRNGGQIHTGLRKTQSPLEKWLGPVRTVQRVRACARQAVPRRKILEETVSLGGALRLEDSGFALRRLSYRHLADR